VLSLANNLALPFQPFLSAVASIQGIGWRDPKAAKPVEPHITAQTIRKLGCLILATMQVESGGGKLCDRSYARAC
jgi:hypothetical protein